LLESIHSVYNNYNVLCCSDALVYTGESANVSRLLDNILRGYDKRLRPNYKGLATQIIYRTSYYIINNITYYYIGYKLLITLYIPNIIITYYNNCFTSPSDVQRRRQPKKSGGVQNNNFFTTFESNIFSAAAILQKILTCKDGLEQDFRDHL